MRLIEVIIRIIVGIPAIGCVAASCYFAFEFGMTRTPDPQAQLYFGAAAVAFDIMKTMLPIIGSRAGVGPRRAAWVGFLMLTGFSLWCAFGLNATTLAEKFSNQRAASSALTDAKAELQRAQGDRDHIPAFVPTEQGNVDAAQAAVDVATQQKKDECDSKRGGRGSLCRDRETDERKALAALSTAQQQKALTDQARVADAKIAAAQRKLDRVDVKTAVKEADPQSQSLHDLTGVPLSIIQLISGMWWALCIEFGSGVGFWLAFHSRPKEPVNVESKSVETASVTVPEPVHLMPIIETPVQVRARFFKTCVLPIGGQRVAGDPMYIGYHRWCTDNGHEPMTRQKFGTDVPWRKQNIGGKIWYLDARLIEAYADNSAPTLRVVNG